MLLLGLLAACGGGEPAGSAPEPTAPASASQRLKLTYYNVDG
jgi:hypothetical protein